MNIVFKLADIGLTEISITQERLECAKFSYPHTISTVTFITSPPKLGSKITLMYSYFDDFIWISFIVTVVIIMLFLWYQAKLLLRNNFSVSIWVTFNMLMKQSMKYSDIPSVLSSRTYLTFWLLFCFVFSTFYGNCIYSQMVFAKPLKAIDTIQELYEENTKGAVSIFLHQDTAIFDLMNVCTLS